MTVDDVVTKTGITLAVIVAFAVINFGLYLGGYGSIASILTVVGAVAGFVLVMIHAFGKSTVPQLLPWRTRLLRACSLVGSHSPSPGSSVSPARTQAR